MTASDAATTHGPERERSGAVRISTCIAGVARLKGRRPGKLVEQSPAVGAFLQRAAVSAA